MFSTLDLTDGTAYLSPSEAEEMLPSDPMGWTDETLGEFEAWL